MAVLLLVGAPVMARTITDIDGQQVTIPDNPQRIVLGESRMLYTLAMLEPGAPFRRIAGWPLDLKKYDAQSWDIFARQFPQMLTIPVLGLEGANDINPEQVIALRPDVVILPSLARYSDADRHLVSMLNAAQIPVVRIDLRVNLLKNTRRSVTLLGEVLSQPDRAAAFNRFYDTHMQRIRERLASWQGAKPSALLQLHLGRRNECCVTAVNGSIGELLAFAGADNIASRSVHGVFGRLSEETVIAAQPEFYFATGMGSSSQPDTVILGPAATAAETQRSMIQLTANQNGLKELQALHNGHAAAVWHNFYMSPWHVAATEFFAKTLYPQLFADVDPQQTLQQLFRDFLPIPYSGVYFYTLSAQ
ncbi:ABC transporter substrate-binding protein [Erwinia sp. V71]|uniref:ABC transporter substrate-binding protein n=1 Tax=Erwinia sp. V71 TaxID=3369424 RepID=UPI003F5DE51E